MIKVVFSGNGYRDHVEGPFYWVEVTMDCMFVFGELGEDAEEIAQSNGDGTWDAGPIITNRPGGGMPGRCAYSKFIVSEW